MSDPRDLRQERLLELLADRAIFGLTSEEESELKGLLALTPDADPDELDRLAANLARSSLAPHFDALPPNLHAKILAEASARLAPGREGVRRRRLRQLGYLAFGLTMAASLLFFVSQWWQIRPTFAKSAAERRNELLAQVGQPGSDAINLAWTTTAEAAAAAASGDLVWSTRAQEGYMLFRGLPANNPAQEQYQLWVFDSARDERYPVDGGVFDVPAGEGEVIVPIRVKLGISRPALFAVTIEPSGGVVVSDRKRLPLLVKVPAPKAG